MPTIFEAKSRASAGEGAPSHGLTLMEIHYGSDAQKQQQQEEEQEEEEEGPTAVRA